MTPRSQAELIEHGSHRGALAALQVSRSDIDVALIPGHAKPSGECADARWSRRQPDRESRRFDLVDEPKIEAEMPAGERKPVAQAVVKDLATIGCRRKVCPDRQDEAVEKYSNLGQKANGLRVSNRIGHWRVLMVAARPSAEGRYGPVARCQASAR